ncbi:MAG: chitobiase/beta-hexosaminidase C-terminal domain-containing protein [Bacteroidales bacterium]|nr:chitobiase/beta-hexosaminidase C-terminal domain-containing protein [Bacteroidales bacterium]
MKKCTLRAILMMAVFLVSFHLTGWGQTMLAAWTFDVTPAAPNTPTVITANLGTQLTSTLYADGTNGSSSWLSTESSPEWTTFGGNILNDPRSPQVAGLAIALANMSANGKSIILKFSMTDYKDPILTFATRGTASGFNNHQWAWSIDNITYTDFGINTAINTSTWTLQTLDMSAINELDNVPIVYIRLVVTGASSPSGNNRLDNVVINATSTSVTRVETPVINPSGGIYTTPQTITMTCATDGATIYYSTDGQPPDDGSTEYDPLNPPQVSITTTVKAIAYKTGMDPSLVATNVYRFPVEVADMAALRAGLTDGTIYKLTGEAIVTYARSSTGFNQKYIQDATGAILIHDPSGIITSAYVIGDGMTGITGTLTLYNSLLELIPVFDPGTATSTGNPIVPEVKTLGNLTSADQSKLVSISTVSFDAPVGNFATGTNYTISDPSKSAGVFRTIFSESDYIETLIPAEPKNMVALVGQFDTEMQITPRNLADITPVASPSITINPATLSGFTYIVGGGPSGSQSSSLSGSNLTPASGSITVTGSADYEVSSDNSAFGSAATFAYAGGTLAPVPVYTRLKSGLSVGTYNETVVVTGGGASDRSLTCEGTVSPGITTYTWSGADGGSWVTPTNWTPTRTTPAATDILRFTDGSTKTVTGVITETIGRLLFSNNTSVNLQSGAVATLTINGGTGDDLSVPAGCALNLNAVNAITIALATGANGSISGSMAFSSTANTAHKLTAVDAGAITFSSGSAFTAGAFLSGNPFGTTNLNSVVFSSGSTYIYIAGSNPFGAGQPNSVVVFQTGSLFKLMSNSTPAFSGRTYANFELDATGAVASPSGANPFSIDNLTVTNGTLNINMTGTPGHSIKGNIHVASTGTLNFNPASAGTVLLNGTTLQTISGEGAISTNANSTIGISNASGVVLNNSAVTLNGALALTNGLLTLGDNNLTLGPAATISGTPSATNMIVATGTGELRKGFSGAGAFTFPVGSNSPSPEYSPVTLDFTNGAFTDAYAGVNLKNVKYPSDPNNLNYVKRYWKLSQNGIAGFTCNAMFQYLPGDVTGYEDRINCARVDVTPYIAYSPANTALHQLTASGLTDLGIFTGTMVVPENQDIGNVTIGSGTTTCYNAKQTITVGGQNGPFLVQDGGSVTMIAGLNILFLPGTKVGSGGYLSAYITQTETYCGAKSATIPEPETKAIAVTTLQSNHSTFRVYPNPTSGSFTLDMSGTDPSQKVNVEIYRMTGEPVLKETLTGESQHQYNLGDQPTGIYILRILNTEMAGTIKIIRQ